MVIFSLTGVKKTGVVARLVVYSLFLKKKAATTLAGSLEPNEPGSRAASSLCVKGFHPCQEAHKHRRPFTRKVSHLCVGSVDSALQGEVFATCKRHAAHRLIIISGGRAITPRSRVPALSLLRGDFGLSAVRR